jgi:aryl-alcohol dehydrogenase-like predicted oxidoreductase
MRRTVPRFAREARNANQRLVDLLHNTGERHKATPSQIALAWLLARKPWIVPLFGTRKLERFEENIGALSVRPTADDMRELNESRTTMGARQSLSRRAHATRRSVIRCSAI